MNLRQVDQVQLAGTIEAGRCVEQYGFRFDARALLSYWKDFVVRDVSDHGLHGNLRRYGPTDASVAAKFGYHMPSEVTVRPGSQDGRHHQIPGFGNVSDAELNILQKDRPGAKACFSSGVEKVTGSVPAISLPDVLGNPSTDSYARSKSAAPIKAAFAQWSKCMAAHGYQYADPTVAGGEFDLQAPKVSERERAAALSDVACKEQVQLVHIWFTWERNYQNRQIAQHVKGLEALKDANDAIVHRADRIVASL